MTDKCITTAELTEQKDRQTNAGSTQGGKGKQRARKIYDKRR